MTLRVVDECALYTADERTKEIVAAACAALGLAIRVISERPDSLPAHGLILVATDLAPTSIPWREGLLLLDLEAKCHQSHASLVGMVGDFQAVATQLMNRVSRLLRNRTQSLLIAVTAPGGGSGVTTLTALLGLSAARTGKSVLLVDDAKGLIRMIGAKCATVDRDLLPASKIGVLAEGVKGLPPLLLDAKRKFDLVIVGVDRLELLPLREAISHAVLLTPNTAIAAERCAAALSAGGNPVHVVVRRTACGTLSAKQMSIALNMPILGEWPDDPELALAADLGELGRSKRAVRRAKQLFHEICGARE